MAKDLVYYYDKKTFVRYELGEIQTSFNMSFVIDGTKDSAKISVFGYVKKSIEPYTIIKHQNTNTWWIVASDKVERYESEDEHYFYCHTIQLLGAIDLLGARDLTNCGFTNGRYTIRQYVLRLVQLSTFSIKGSKANITFNSKGFVDNNHKIDYFKTFENYTLLSALRELFDGYNCSVKMNFGETTYSDNHVEIASAEIYLVSKTGDSNSAFSDSYFNDIREIRTINSNSFGTTIVSNAQNVISSKVKRYPSVGGVKFYSNQNEITGENARLRVPSNIYKVNSVIMFPTMQFQFQCMYFGNLTNDYFNLCVADNVSAEVVYNKFLEHIRAKDTQYGINFEQYVVADKDRIINRIESASKFIINSVSGYDGLNNKYITDKKMTRIYSRSKGLFRHWGDFAVGTEELRDSLYDKYLMLGYKQGNDYISGFNLFSSQTNASVFPEIQTYVEASTSELGDEDRIFEKSLGGNEIVLKVSTINENIDGSIKKLMFSRLNVFNTRWAIEYVPMSDIKIKYDNTSETNDMQIYNQNGKLTDSLALSKLILSYSKETQNDNITKFGVYYAFGSVPKVGSIVNIDDDFYVINNVSCNFELNERDTYCITCEFTLNINVSTKSALTNPSSDIRDYNIPQNRNVDRPQLYRDFYELSVNADSGSDNEWYLPLSKILNLGNENIDDNDHVAVLKIGYNEPVGGATKQDYWYYQLDTTRYVLKKEVYEILNLKDNNIIAYDLQSSFTGFDITKIFSGFTSAVNTPISYTDLNGECKSFSIAFCTNEQITTIYENLALEVGVDFDTLYISKSVFIDSRVYEGGVNFSGANTEHDFLIEETNYGKDAIEVPIFEYSCQIDDSAEIIVGDNVLDNNASCYLYCFAIANKGLYNENNYRGLIFPTLSISSNIATINSSAMKMEYITNQSIRFSAYNNVSYDLDTSTPTYGSNYSFSSVDFTKKDIVVVRYNIGELYDTTINYSESVFGSGFIGQQTFEVYLEEGQTLVSADIELSSGYKSDSVYAPQPIIDTDGTRVRYIIGGENYDDTIAQGQLNITITTSPYTATKTLTTSVKGSQGNKRLVLPLTSDDVVSGTPTIQVVGTYASDPNAYANVISYDDDVKEIIFEGGLLNNANQNISVAITYTYSNSGGTRTITEYVSGTKTQTQYITPILNQGETITSATFSNVELVNNNIEGAYAQVDSFTSAGVVKYTMGQSAFNQKVYGVLKLVVSGQKRDITQDLMFVIKGLKSTDISGNQFDIAINHYKID